MRRAASTISVGPIEAATGEPGAGNHQISLREPTQGQKVAPQPWMAGQGSTNPEGRRSATLRNMGRLDNGRGPRMRVIQSGACGLVSVKRGTSGLCHTLALYKEIRMAKKQSSRGRKQDSARVAGGQDYEVGYEARKTG